jgi:hypothetical protein
MSPREGRAEGAVAMAVNGAAIKWKRKFSADLDALLKYA